MPAVAFVIAPVLRSKLSANDASPDRAAGEIPKVVLRKNGKVIWTVSALTSSLRKLLPFPATYVVPVDDPVPDTLDRSTTGMTTVFAMVAARAGAPAPQTSPARTTTRSDSTTGLTNNRRIFMFRSFSFRSSSQNPACHSVAPRTVSEGGWQDVIRVSERHALRCRDRRRQRPQERRSPVVDLPAQQHGVVLMRGVVTVLHEHPAKVPELHGDGDASVRAQAIDVLAPLLPRRHIARASVAGEDLSLLEVDVDRVIPAAAVVPQGPDLARTE